MPTADQIRLVRESWRRITPSAERVADLFYRRLFELDPSLRVMFSGDMTQQEAKLMQMIAVVVDHLDRWSEVVPDAQALGRRHVQYGVIDAHYNTVGEAFLWTLEQELGEACTAETRRAWTVVYATLATVMRDAANEGVPAA